MFDSMQHAEKAVAALARYGYAATIRKDEDRKGFDFMTLNPNVKQDRALLIEPRSEDVSNSANKVSE